MARVKDRLIFENKKIEAVAQRKSNQEQKLRSKEAHSNKIAEKAKKKKDNLKAVDEWAQSAATKRGGKYDDNDDKGFLKNLSSPSSNKKNDKKRPWTDRDGNLQMGPNKKRLAADKKYGYGKRQGRFKQNDPKEANDMSKFNPKGNFGGQGSKKGPGGAGAKRQGKRARDANRSREGR
jgi:rRNA-processing protein EBP2